jgi:L-threonylcarbamoyladenylate synthase
MDEKEIINNVKKGKIFIYPTDTIYGIGCDATNSKAVEKVKEIKKRDKTQPLSVIAPSIDWIKNNLRVDKNLNLDKYFPGAYTLILKKKDKKFLNWVSDKDSLGVRIPKSDFCNILQKSNLPFVTTSVNLSGEEFAIEINDITHDILEQVDFIIEEGKLSGKPSTLIIDGKEVKR